jgi:membrane dipeptidase
VPVEVDTIADLQKLAQVLSGRGYSDDDVVAIFGGNWRAYLERALPRS